MSNSDIENRIFIEEKFVVAQVVLYLFAALQIVLALMTAFGAAPIAITAQASTMQRLLATTSSVINILCFAGGYVLLAYCMNRCTRLVWRIAMGVFLLNAGVAALAVAIQHNLFPVLTCGLAVAGAISVWNGRHVVQSPSAE